MHAPSPLRPLISAPFKVTFFYLFIFEGTFTLFFKDKKSERSRKTVEIKGFLTIFAL
jgi:hypothetical protein